MKRRLGDMVVLITGASAGIGEALARTLAGRGARLVLAARRLELLEAINASVGGGHLCVRADVSDPAACEELVGRAVERFGRLDTLVCNAGYGLARSVADTSPQEMRRLFAVNVFGTTDCARAAAPVMARQEKRDGYRGQMMIVSSAAGRRGLPYFGAYSATKSAQLGIAEALRVELKPSRIAVTSVHPIGTDTEFFRLAEGQAAAAAAVPVAGRQSAASVAGKMARAIEKPRPELWPHRPTRWLINLGIMLPRLADRVMGKYRDEWEKAGSENRSPGGKSESPGGKSE